MKFKIVQMESGCYKLYQRYFFLWFQIKTLSSIEECESWVAQTLEIQQVEKDWKKAAKMFNTPVRIVKIIDTKAKNK